jgi:iron complex transport system ATP-binding protein
MEALKKVGMDSMKDRVYSTLSGGEQQRIILARALAQDAGTLIMDEPTNHLDIKYQLQIMNVVKEHKGAIICALHDLNLALTYCSYVYILKQGELAFEGRPEEVITAENIYKVYEVKAKVLTLEETGRKYVVYYS